MNKTEQGVAGLIARLRRDTGSRIVAESKCHEAADIIEAQERTIAELRKDAERYRWLREGDNDEVVLVFSNEAHCGTDTVWVLRYTALDSAIDAAMKGEK